MPLSLDYSTKPDGGFGTYSTQLKMRKLKRQLVISIHDQLSGTMLETSRLTPPAAAADRD
jgi:hypothetical protein